MFKCRCEIHTPQNNFIKKLANNKNCFHDLICMMLSLYKIGGIIILLDLTIIILILSKLMKNLVKIFKNKFKNII
jgi:hypothetical protein